MKIKIEQTLHGYRNGHQLLNASLELSNEAKQLLLLQSDLSGSNIEKGFETYLTGYPVKDINYFALARTWYAQEMRRPGCVWTQTLLINYADLGKIPDLSTLDQYFIRPHENIYNNYSQFIEIDILYLIEQWQSQFQSSNVAKSDKEVLLTGLYEYPANDILYPTIYNKQLEQLVFNVWSDQWPRLRRNFTFCTGALDFKFLDGKPFDLQIIPSNRSHIIFRESDKALLSLNLSSQYDWRQYLEYPTDSLRSFLWGFGADVPGTRANLIPLLRIFSLLQDTTITLPKILRLFQITFPQTNEARSLKIRVFGANSILEPIIGEKAIVTYLLNITNFDILPIEDLGLQKRLQKLVEEGAFTITEILELFIKIKDGPVSINLLQYIEHNKESLSEVIKQNPEYAELIISHTPELATNNNIWSGEIILQKKILDLIINRDLLVSWQDVTTAILNTNSEIIWQLYQSKGQQIIFYSLDWLNAVKGNNCLISGWSRFIATEKKSALTTWINNCKDTLSPKIFAILFIYIPANGLPGFNIPTESWVRGYHTLKSNNYAVRLPYAAAALLSLGLSNRMSNAVTLVIGTFHDVYSFAASQNIDVGIWSLIPRDNSQEDEEITPLIQQIFHFLGANSPKKQYQVDEWDYCEQLVRTLVNKFLKYGWPYQAFLDSLHNAQSFSRAFNYSLSFKKGRNFQYRIMAAAINGKIESDTYQLTTYQKFAITVGNRKQNKK